VGADANTRLRLRVKYQRAAATEYSGMIRSRVKCPPQGEAGFGIIQGWLWDVSWGFSGKSEIKAFFSAIVVHGAATKLLILQQPANSSSQF